MLEEIVRTLEGSEPEPQEEQGAERGDPELTDAEIEIMTQTPTTEIDRESTGALNGDPSGVPGGGPGAASGSSAGGPAEVLHRG